MDWDQYFPYGQADNTTDIPIMGSGLVVRRRKKKGEKEERDEKIMKKKHQEK